jgi:protein phosphatase
MLRAHGVSNKGRVRRINEDCFAIEAGFGLCVVADGMGGHNAGEIASRIAVDTVTASVLADSSTGESLRRPDIGHPELSVAGHLLRRAVQLANQRILDAALTAVGYAGMGTTIVAALVRGNRLTVCHAGDSRLYLYDGRALLQITQDDSWIAAMARDPDVDRALLGSHPMRHALTNAVGAGSTEVHVTEKPVADGDVMLLTTDGVHGVLSDGQMAELLGEGDVAAAAANLVTAAVAAGSRDDCTAVVARYSER